MQRIEGSQNIAIKSSSYIPMMFFLLPVAQYQHPYLDLGENMSDFDIFTPNPEIKETKMAM